MAVDIRQYEPIDLQTPEGMLRAHLGDYIVHDGAGGFWKESRSVFQRSFTAVTAPAAPPAGGESDEGGSGEGE
ncbi:hypothetical protein HII36_22010 [Nonomuraea sp. NN258]|uniref:hypothetical protein n=1 Tax=Nonomuraea antri TaxID=2730852 RepID=UPI001569908B|nr:hypothetical protein [Nonomuraea antri]NRQ34503.1 hypothetical protein [Nonomuraea antri]